MWTIAGIAESANLFGGMSDKEKRKFLAGLLPVVGDLVNEEFIVPENAFDGLDADTRKAIALLFIKGIVENAEI